MGRARKEVLSLSEEAAETVKKFDEKIDILRKKREETLKRIAEKQKQKEYKMARKLLDEIKDISGILNEEIISNFLEYMKINRIEISEYIIPTLLDDNVETDTGVDSILDSSIGGMEM